jgi:tripartite ATP-independent transporter DctM subunit
MISSIYIFLNDIPWLVISHVLTSSTDSFVLTAIPLFILTAALMEQGEVTDRIIDFCKDLVGHLPGGLAHVNIVTSVIFAGMSGSALADAGGPGMVEVRMMREGGYDDDFTVAITAASALIGPIIPPSIPMVVYGAISRESVGKLFLGGFIPGVLIAIALMIQAHLYAKKRNYPTSKRPPLKQVAYHFYKVFLALLTPVIILGGIATGFFTPTEAAAVAAVYAMVLGFFVYRALTWQRCLKTLLATAMLTGVIVFIMAMAALWSWMLTNENITGLLIEYLTSLTSSPAVMLFLIVLSLLILGCFIEPLAIMIMVLPVFLPILQAYGIGLLHFGVVMTLALMIGLLTPPFGELLFILTAITGVPVGRVAWATAPYLIGIGAVLFLIMYVPSLVTWLPGILIK